MRSVNWNNIISVIGPDKVSELAKGNIGYKGLEQLAKSSIASSDIRLMLRNGGISRAKELAKKACIRRGLPCS